MDINSIFPLGSNNMFPDNGLITQSYDSRVTQNDMRQVSAGILKQGNAFYREEMLDGTGKYTWSTDFITKVNASFQDGVIPNFTKTQRKLFDEYMLFAKDGLLPSTTEDIIQLDLYLGSI